MRARIFLGAGTVSFVAAAFVIQACGDTEEPVTQSTADSGPDVVVDAGPKEAAAEEKDSAAPCDTSADFTKGIPDASIADGASTSGICLGCATTKCKSQVDACRESCTCQEMAGGALDCYLKNTANPLVCAAGLSGVDSETQQIGLAIIGCLNNACKEECAAPDGGL
jgi:hypothetical protein